MPRKTAQLQIPSFFPNPRARRSLHPVCCMVPRPRAWDSIWLQLPTHDCFPHRGTKAISIPEAFTMASCSILASAPATAELPCPSPGELQVLHELIGHPLGTEFLCKVIRWTPQQGAGGKEQAPSQRWAWVLLSFCHNSWAKPSVSTVWRVSCSLELVFYPFQLTAHQGQLFISSTFSLTSPENAHHLILTRHHLRYPHAGANAPFRRVVYQTF